MYAWYINPLVEVTVIDDDGQPTGDSYFAPYVDVQGYSHTSSIGVGSWVLSLVRGDDFTILEQSPNCELVFNVPANTHPEVFLGMTLLELGTTQGEENTLHSKLSNAGIDTSDLDRNNSAEEWLSRITETTGGGAVRGMYV